LDATIGAETPNGGSCVISGALDQLLAFLSIGLIRNNDLAANQHLGLRKVFHDLYLKPAD
jgi:hypothetical protein